jgi:hypothetical protein
MANDETLSPDEARFIDEFKLPDRHRFPGAYRILKTNWYSADRLFVLWGLEPSANEAMPVIKLLAGPAGSPLPDQPSAGPMGGGGGAGSSGLGASSSRGGIPVGGSAGGVTTTGLRFGLDGSELIPWSTRGVSNEFVAPVASVTEGAGVVMAIVPDEADRVVINTHEQLEIP